MKILYNHKVEKFIETQDSDVFLPIKNLDEVTYVKDELCKNLDGLGLIYSKNYIKRVRRACNYKSDIAEFHGDHMLFKSAVISANLAISAALNGDFAITRPAGHHASDKKYEGFCLFNNLALGISSLRRKDPNSKVLIIDFDGHHGNGTEMIFREDENIMMYSVAQINTYPLDSSNEKVLYKRKKKLSIKILLEVGTKGEELLNILKNQKQNIKKFNPDIVAVSAGFDGYQKDRLLSLNFDINTYYKLGEYISSLGTKTFSVLEGGYHEDVGDCINAFISGINGDD